VKQLVSFSTPPSFSINVLPKLKGTNMFHLSSLSAFAASPWRFSLIEVVDVHPGTTGEAHPDIRYTQ
jgi:hypothetical protein